MWGQNWGTFIWGSSTAVPASGFWSVLLLGIALGAVGVKVLKATRARTLAIFCAALAVLAPFSAKALPFVFSNGTVADATQVNANFAALTPINGQYHVSGTPNGSQWPILTPSFVAPRNLVCTVTVMVQTIVSTPTTGLATLHPSKSENGVLDEASAPPLGGVIPEWMELSTNTGTYQASRTVQFSVSAGSTVQFGAQMFTSGSFATSTYWKMAATYTCF